MNIDGDIAKNDKEHIIFFMDDISQVQNDILQDLRANGKITIVYINDTYADVAPPLAGYMRLSSVEKHISDL